MNQCPPGPQVFHWGRFEFFKKIRGDIREWLTPAINPCHGEITKKPNTLEKMVECPFSGFDF